MAKGLYRVIWNRNIKKEHLHRKATYYFNNLRQFLVQYLYFYGKWKPFYCDAMLEGIFKRGKSIKVNIMRNALYVLQQIDRMALYYLKIYGDNCKSQSYRDFFSHYYFRTSQHGSLCIYMILVEKRIKSFSRNLSLAFICFFLWHHFIQIYSITLFFLVIF